MSPQGVAYEKSGLAKTIQYFIVAGFGLLSSALVAAILATVENRFGIALYSFMNGFVVPTGAIFSGVAAASGCYFGARLFQYRPTRLLLFNIISVALAAYFLINYLNYSFARMDGQHVSISFGQYLSSAPSHRRMRFRFRGVKAGETGDLGAFGYVVAALQALGFAAGGFAVYEHLRRAPYCSRCQRYLRKQSSLTRYTDDAKQLQRIYSELVEQVAEKSNASTATDLLSRFGAAKSALRKKELGVVLELWKCKPCNLDWVELEAQIYDGTDWRPIPRLRLNRYLTSSAPLV